MTSKNRQDSGGATVNFLDFHDLIVSQVSALVSATADEVAQAENVNVLKVEAQLYRLLEVNCAKKAQLAEGFAKAWKPAPQTGKDSK